MHRCLVLVVVLSAAAWSQPVNRDEAKVPSYELPDLLTFTDGTKVDKPEAWPRRRNELLRLFETHIYGRMPSSSAPLAISVRNEDRSALGGKATRRQISIRWGKDPDAWMDVLLWIPNQRSGPVPAFLGLNFFGNHSTHLDPEITLSTRWMRNSGKVGIRNHRATEKSRGANRRRWPVETILDRGYALATVYCGDIDPDYHDGFLDGVHPLHPMKNGEARRDDAWGTICAWAWGLSRALDALEREAEVDGTRVAVLGHSRLGKTALWAGACDERFALVISNDSGCGGAALSRRCFGETVSHITKAMPHWFCTRFQDYVGREHALPVDQHGLVALIAPRPCLVSSAAEDAWADPKGEFLAVRGADPVYRLLVSDGLPTTTWPKPGNRSLGRLGYHIRPGPHDVNAVDWAAFLDFADLHLQK